MGLLRRSNQDSFGLDEALQLFVVCDGMGGSAAGEVASSLAVKTFLHTAQQELLLGAASPVKTRNALWRATLASNRAVYAKAGSAAEFQGMGTTLVGAVVEDSLLTLINVGDSRGYLVRNGIAYQLTLDHSYVAESVRRGLMTEEQARHSAMQSVITRAVGTEVDVHPEIFEEPLEAGDVLLLASDGLTRHVSDAAIAEVLSQQGQSAVEGCRLLIELAKEDGGTDNITCMVVRFSDADSEPRPGMTPWLDAQ
ncbi:PP2C family protein-serine/threonine phosphatase [Granulicella cerasi]|uniref:PP2C family protein-serine/threonine phosphatase n=1 Tax=Granulicella cerasi TaxID=741063 RepID=A0ABW1Z5G0_9BACT|nr:PP2C family serine/threonine-protein phosphatase [Granulicella cerasi]